MANFSSATFTNATNITSREGNTADVPSVAGSIIIIIINTITCPFTVLLNVLVIKAVKTTPRLRTNNNILLACLAVTDALTGLLSQPLFILWKIFLLVGLSNSEIVEDCYYTTVILTGSYFLLMLVTFERLIAIKFTMQYSNIITDENMKKTVLAVFIIEFIQVIFRALKLFMIVRFMVSLIIISCTLFLSFAYFIMYRETRRHQRKIKTQRMLREEVERFTKENKALKTTVFIVGAIIVFLLPVCFCLVIKATGLYNICPINEPLMQTFAMLNSLFNPLIYCWRQKEMRKVIFRLKTQVVPVDNQ